MKATKTQGQEAYDKFHGILRCHNGGTTEENLRNAQHCYDRMTEHMPVVAEVVANAGKRLKDDAWLMSALTKGIPDRYDRFAERYPHVLAVSSDNVIQFPKEVASV